MSKSVAPDSSRFPLRSLVTEGSGLESLWRQEQLCDVVLRSTDGFCTKSHKIILAAASPFFRALFTGAGNAMAENQSTLPSGENVVTLHSIAANTLQSVVNAIYTNAIEISDDRLKPLLEAANLLQISAIKDACCEYLRGVTNLENCLSVLEIADTYNCLELHEDTVKYVCNQFGDILLLPQLPSLVQCLSKDSLLQIVQNQDITVESERQILSFGLEWIRADITTRLPEAEEVISRVQLAPSVIDEAIRVAGMDPGQLLPTVQVEGPANGPNVGSIERSPTHILVAGGHDASWRTFKTVELYDPLDDTWSSGASMRSAFSLADAARLSRSAFVVGGSMFDANVCQYDKRRRHWRQFTPLNTARIHAAVAAVGCALYVCGGRTGTTGCLSSTEICRSVSEPTWIDGPSLLEPRCSFGMASLNGELFAVGGQSGRHIHDTVEVLQRGAERWTLLQATRLQTPRKYLSIGTVAGRIFAVGGMNEQRVRLSTVEALDPREGKWRYVCQLRVPRSSCGAATLREKLYVLGGNARDDVIHHSMECYVPEADAWMPCAQMLYGRSGLSAVAI